MHIVRRTRVCTAAYGVLHWLWWLWLCGAGTRAVCNVKVTVRQFGSAAVRTLVLLMMGIMMPETCWDKSLIINIRLVASCWFLSLNPAFMMHGHRSLKRSKMYQVVTNAVHRMLLSWWLYIKSIKCGSIYLVSGSSSLQVWYPHDISSLV